MKLPYGDTHESWIKRKYVNENQHVKLLNQTQVNTIIHRYGIKYIPIKMRCCCKSNKELRTIGVLRYGISIWWHSWVMDKEKICRSQTTCNASQTNSGEYKFCGTWWINILWDQQNNYSLSEKNKKWIKA